jgi:peptide deformylase
MPVKTVLQLGDPRLREIALPVKDPGAPQIKSLVGDLADTLAHWRSTTGYGRGIAAPQLGVSLRLIFLQLPGAQPWPLVNPEIIERSSEKIVVWETLCTREEFEKRYRDASPYAASPATIKG